MLFRSDVTELGSDPDATANVPGGVLSGSTADANSDNKPDGYHTWGNFTGSSLGNNNNIDTYVYGPSVTSIVNIAVAPDEVGDADGVASGTELGATNFGDGNGDGTSDYLQSGVSSLPDTVSGGYSTVAETGCTGLSNVATYAESQLSASDTVYDYPVGLHNFHITCASPGATASVKVYYDKVYDTSTWKPRKFSHGAYADIPGAVFGQATTGATTVTTLTYSVTDGGPLDDDGTANGTIVDPVGPGVVQGAAVTAPNTGLAPQNGTISILFTLTGLLILAGGVAHVRRNIHPRA